MSEKLFNDGLNAERGFGLSHSVGRREFLGGLAALGASALIPGVSTLAQAPAAAKPFRIDVHYHFSSPKFIEAITLRKTGQKPLMDWTPAKAIEAMDRDGVATSVMS